MSSPILCIGKYSFYSKKKQKKYRPLYGSEGPTMENCTVAVLHAMSCRCSGTLSRRVSKQGSELLGACRAHRPLADAHVLHAKSSPALAPQFIACNTPTQFITLRAISIARNDCTQETARSRWRDAGKDQIGPKNWENAIEGPSLPCNFTPMGLPTHLGDVGLVIERVWWQRSRAGHARRSETPAAPNNAAPIDRRRPR